MEYIKFETEELNKYFAELIGKKDYTLEDIQKHETFMIKDSTITQKDLDILSKITDKKVIFEGMDCTGLDFGKCNYSKLVFSNCNLKDARIADTQTPDILIELEDCKDITTEKLKKLKETSNTNFKFEVNHDLHEAYDIYEFSTIISTMEEIKDSIPENSTDLEKFLFVYNVLGKKIVYDKSGCQDNELFTEEAGKSTRSLMGTLINGRGICAGYALAVEQVSKYVGLEVEKVGADVHLKNGEEGGHAWNKVKIGEKWYYADLTWDYKHLNDLKYCLKSPLDKDFREEHDMVTDDVWKKENEEKTKELSQEQALEYLFDNLFSDSKTTRTDEEEKDLFERLGYAAESYNPEIAKETMQMVNSWAELDNALARIDALKKNGNKSFNKTNEKVEAKFDLSDINSAIGQVCLDSYKSVQEAIKDAREDKEYEQTK